MSWNVITRKQKTKDSYPWGTEIANENKYGSTGYQRPNVVQIQTEEITIIKVKRWINQLNELKLFDWKRKWREWEITRFIGCRWDPSKIRAWRLSYLIKQKVWIRKDLSCLARIKYYETVRKLSGKCIPMIIKETLI